MVKYKYMGTGRREKGEWGKARRKNISYVWSLLFFLVIAVFFGSTALSQQINLKTKFEQIYGHDKKTTNIDNSLSSNVVYIGNYDSWRPKVGLALSGGGSRGFAQIGVLKVFKKNDIPIDYITGTSIGSVVGGLYAVGYSPDELDSIVRNTKWDEILALTEETSRSDYFLDQKIIRDRSLVTLRYKNFNFVVPEAISVGNKFNAFLQRLIWNGIYRDNGDFNSLKVPFGAVTTDLISGETIMLSSGNLITAIKASSSIPLRYTPVRLDSMVLVDGGLMANIPVKALDEFNPDLTFAVNTISPLLKYEELDKPWNIADQVVSILMKRFSDSVQIFADMTIEPDLYEHKNNDFSKLDSLIIKGEQKANELISQIKQRFHQHIEEKLKSTLIKLPEHFSGLQLKGLSEEDSNYLSQALGNNFSKNKFIETIIDILIKDNYREIEIKSNGNDNVLSFSAEGYGIVNKIIINDLHDTLTSALEKKVNDNFSNSILNLSKFTEISEYILNQLRSSGLSFSGISDVGFNEKSGELSYIILSPKINSIKIESTGEYDFLIRRELNFKEGKTASADNLMDSWENINSLDFISNVELQISNECDSCLNVFIKTTDIGDQTVRLGMRVDNERFTQLGVDMIQDNIFNLGTRLSLRFAGGLRNQDFVLKAENTRIFSTFLTSAYSIYYGNNYRNLYQKKILSNRNRFENERSGEMIEERYGVKLMLGAQIERKGTFSGSLRYENFRLWEDSKKIIPKYKSFVNVKIGAIFDTEDNPDFAIEGSVLDMSLESSLYSTKDNISFSKVNFKYHFNYSQGIHTLKPILRFGFADETTPQTEFYNLGGQDIFFGIHEDESRGRQIAAGSLEYRIKSPYFVFFDTYLYIRYDIGYAWENFETIRVSTLHHGIGGTLGFDTPVGPAKFSIGRSFYFLKNPNAVSWGPVMGYFSIGMRL